MKLLRKEHVVILALLLALAVFGVLVGRKYLSGNRPSPSDTAVVEEPPVLREVRLYFGAADDLYLMAETRELKNCPDDPACLRQTVQALVEGPTNGLVPILPPHTVIRGITEKDGVASIDFSREFVTGHPGGSVSELLTVYGLADTLAENFPHVRQVRVLVEGQSVQTLKGHVDLSRPIAADFRFVRRLEARSDAETVAAEEIAEAASAADRQMTQPPEPEASDQSEEIVLPDSPLSLDGPLWDDPEMPVEENTR